jgi:hypothetical protein
MIFAFVAWIVSLTVFLKLSEIICDSYRASHSEFVIWHQSEVISPYVLVQMQKRIDQEQKIKARKQVIYYRALDGPVK